MNEHLVMTIVAGVWVTVLMTRSYFYQWYRNLMAKWEYTHYLSECALCTGTWVGLVFSQVLGHSYFFVVPSTSLLSYALVLWIDKTNSIIDNNQENKS